MARTSTRPRRSSPLSLPSAFDVFRESYDLVKKHFDVFMVLFAISFLMALWDSIARYVDEKEQGHQWGNLIANGLFGPDVNSALLKTGIISLIFGVLYIISSLLIPIAALRAAQGKSITLKGLWNELTSRWLWIKLIAAIIIVVLFILIGLILLIVPGIILVWRLFFVPYILIDQKTAIDKAIGQSWNMTRGFAGPIYAVILVTILISLIKIIPLLGGLVAFVLGSIYMLAPALRYEQVKKARQLDE